MLKPTILCFNTTRTIMLQEDSSYNENHVHCLVDSSPRTVSENPLPSTVLLKSLCRNLRGGSLLLPKHQKPWGPI